MTDLLDQAAEMEQQNRDIARHYRKPAGPKATGLCLNCDRPLADGKRWCDAECRDEWHEWHIVDSAGSEAWR